MMFLGTSTAAVNRHTFQLTVGGTGLISASTGDGNSISTAATGTSISTSTWFHAAGVWDVATGTDRAAFLNGAGKGTNTTNETPVGIDRTSIGARVASTTDSNFGAAGTGYLAACGLWNPNLTDAEIAVLAAGVSPLLVRPGNLVSYWPLIGTTSPEIDLVGGFNMSIQGTLTQANHPRIYYPHGRQRYIPVPPAIAEIDFSPGSSTEARYLASTGMPWDLMAWGFDKGKDLGWSIKPAEHLMQDAPVVLMQGGGFQIYHQPTRSGHVVEPIIAQEEAVAEFCRARQAASHKSATVPQVALLLSSESFWDKSDAVFSPWGDVFLELEGALHALLNLRYSVDILAEHQLQPRLREFPLVVVPDSHKLSADFRDALTDYVAGGGSLLLLGEKCARLLEPTLGATLIPRQLAMATNRKINNSSGIKLPI